MKKQFFLVLLLLLTLALVCACGTDGQPADSDSPNNEDQTPASAGTIGSDKRPVRISMAALPVMDPALMMNYVNMYWYLNIYDALTRPDPSGSGEMVGWLAHDWEISDDGLTYTFYLNEGVKFHDGSELTAADVVFSMNRILTIGEGFHFLFKDYLAEAAAPDDYTVVFTLNQPYGSFVAALTRLYIVNEDLLMANTTTGGSHEYGEFGDYGREYLLSHDAGSGAYTLTELAEQSYIYAAQFADYFIPFADNAPTSVTIYPITDAATIKTMMSNRELDISDYMQNNESLKALDAIDGVDICCYNAIGQEIMQLNTQKAPTDDIYVRKAIACLVDYATVRSNIFVQSLEATSIVNQGNSGYAKPATQYAYSLEQAEEYLKQSKYYGSLDQYPVEFAIINSTADYQKVGLMLQSAASQVGLTITLLEVPYATWLSTIAKPDTAYHISCNSLSSYYLEGGSTLYSLFHSSMCGASANAGWVESAEYDTMIESALATVDDNERYAAYAELQEYVKDQCWKISMVDKIERCAYQTYVDWPAAQEYAAKGAPSSDLMGYQFWFHDFGINN